MFIHSEDIKNQVQNLCYDLLAYSLAESDFRDLRHPIKEWWCIFENDFKEIYNRRFYPKLIMLSSIIRVSIDNNNIKRYNEKSLGYKINNKSGKKSDLNLKKCANKIIHAREVNIELEKTNSHPLGYDILKENQEFKNIIIKIQDNDRDVEYTSTIYLIKFIEHIMFLIDDENFNLMKINK